MQPTRPDFLLPGLAVSGGIVTFGLRTWLWRTGYSSDTQLFTDGHPAAMLFALLAVILAAAFALALRRAGGKASTPSAYHCPSSVCVTISTAAAMLFLPSGVLGLLEGMEQLALWRTAPDSVLLTYPVTLILCALLAFGAAVATLLLGKGSYREEYPAISSLVVLIPPATGLTWLFSTHLAHGTDPVLMRYGVSLWAVAALMLAHYYAAACFHDRPCPRRAAFFALMGIFLGLASYADGPSPFRMLLTASFVLSALSGVCPLLRSLFGPPWPKRLQADRMPQGAQSDDTGANPAED